MKIERARHGHVRLEVFEASLLQCTIWRYVEGIRLAEQPLQAQPLKVEVGAAPHAFDADGRVILIDEVMTPDSSRFWAADVYTPGRPQPSFDKQPLRDYLDAERRAGRWNGDAPPPPLPDSVVDATSKRYLEAYRLITGTDLETGR